MLDLINLNNVIEQAEFFLLIFLGIIEIGIDFFGNNQRNYRDTAVNIAIAIVYGIFNIGIGYVVALSGIEFASQFSLMEIPINGWTMFLAVAIADFLYYWEHRFEHRIRFFWAYHNVHHSSTDYNLTVASRLSWVEVCVLWIFYLPMALLGFNPLQILIAVQIITVYQSWIHTQKIGRLGILEKTLNTPALHRVHHGSNPLYIDKNYGAILMIWDRLFGTYQPEIEPSIYGLTENIQTNNLLKINLVEYQRIISHISHSQNLQEVFYSIFGSPQWKPKKLSYIHSQKSLPEMKRR